MLHTIASSVAFYCQRCGKIHIFDIPYFSGKVENIIQCDNCSHKIASVSLERGKGIVIVTYCGVCKTKNVFEYPFESLNKKSFEKIFCKEDGFEIGYIGRWESIAEFLDYTRAEYESIYSNGENFSDSQQILLEAVNRVHDLAEMGAINCPCKSHRFRAFVEDESIVLECKNCENYAVISVKNVKDLKKIKKGMKLKFFKPEKLKMKFEKFL